MAEAQGEIVHADHPRGGAAGVGGTSPKGEPGLRASRLTSRGSPARAVWNARPYRRCRQERAQRRSRPAGTVVG